MTGEKKSPERSGRLSVKRGTKLMSKSSQPSSNATTNPPKAATTAPSARKDEVYRRMNPFNDMLRRRDGGDVVQTRDPQYTAMDVEEVAPVAPEQRSANKVLELEQALAAARQEQELLRQEIEAARTERQADQDLINELRLRITRSPPVEASTKKRRSSDVSANEPEEDIRKDNYELRYRVAQLQDQITLRDSTRPDHSSSHTETEWNILRSRLHTAEKESQERMQQLISLKKSISSLTRMDSQATDSDLTEAFSQLFDRIRDWVVSNFRRSRLDFDNVPHDTLSVLRGILPSSMKVTGVDKIALYQAIVSHFCMRILEEPLLVGIPVPEALHLPDSASLGAFRRCDQDLQGGGSVYHEWQRATIRAIEQSHVRDVVQQFRDDLLHQIAGDIGHVLFTMTSISLTLKAKSALVSILGTAVEMQRTLALQKAHYRVLLFHREDGELLKLDCQRMEVVNDFDRDAEDYDISGNREMLFCVSPCLEKFGDEHGEHMESRNVLFRARVCYAIDE
ncbi:hypothetical protein T440DRAFT_557238 [Plenodomus tracheiphilus IPT5]|uniref:Uncharacterized protein n=1 Tax=Plenodomus tracheiphilus IPT5 TaxID=1408161 RepID=A0A6A7AXJ4_9PLEO|nr:hypothetical protein T440DRAFT_557238 [Plenodomus tracheiphilus IPT5]